MNKNGSHLIAVIGSKGGVGSSLFSSNIAIAVQQFSRQKTILLDLDLQSGGDQFVLFGLRGGQPLVNLSKMRKIDPALLKPFLVQHSSGVSIASAIFSREQVSGLSSNHIGEAIDHWMRESSYIVVDCGSEIGEIAASVLEKASLIIVVTNPELLVIKRTKGILDQLQSMLFPADLSYICLNKQQERAAITPQMVQSNLPRPIVGVVPEDLSSATTSVTKGSPIIQLSPRSAISQSILSITRTIFERGLLDKGKSLQKPKISAKKVTPTLVHSIASQARIYDRSTKNVTRQDPWIELKLRIHDQLSQTMDLKKIDTQTGNDPKRKAVLKEQTKRAVLAIIEKEKPTLAQSREERARLVKELLDEALALGPLEDLIADPSISEIMVNGKDQIYIERNGRLEAVNTQFVSDAQLLGIIERIVMPIGRRIDEKTPYCDARLPDGSRVHAIIPPLALQGPTITIRKFSKEALQVSDLIKLGSVTQDISSFLKACINAKLNVLISGGTGTGKTTLLNILSSYISPNERIITIEDSAELQLKQPHTIRLESRPPNIEGEGAVTIRDLVRNALRMRPDRIVVGECRAGEALDMLQAMNTGHDGSLTTIHSNSPRDALVRLETLVMMAGMDLPSRAIREQISSAIDLVIQISRFPDGTRKISHVTEVLGMEGEVITTQDIFVFQQSNMSLPGKTMGKFIPTGFIPRFVEQLTKRGIVIPRTLFKAA